MPSDVMKTVTPLTTVPPPFLNHLIVSEKLGLVWDYARGQTENDLPSPFYELHSPNKSTSAFSEIAPPSVPASSKSFTGKLWGVFSKAQTSVIALSLPTDHYSEPRSLTKKKSKPNVLKKRHTKSSPNIKSLTLGTSELAKVNTFYAPVPDLPPHPTPVSSGSSLEEAPSFSADSPVSHLPDSAIYFTVDPSWDPSKGDADIYLLPFPDAVIENPVLQSIPNGTVTHLKTSTHAGKTPQNFKSVVKTDNETSFLFFK